MALPQEFYGFGEGSDFGLRFFATLLQALHSL